MDVEALKLKLSDFTGRHPAYWMARRVLLGLYLSLIYLYAVAFAVAFQSGELGPLSQGNPETNRIERSAAEPGQKETAESPPATPSDSELPLPRGLDAPFPRTQVQLMLFFGALGGVFSLTRTFVRTTREADFSVAWYLTRPFQGALMALFIYLAFLAGQIVFYSGSDEIVNPKEINLYTLSLLAIIGGMFTDQAYDGLRSIAMRSLIPGNRGAPN